MKIFLTVILLFSCCNRSYATTYSDYKPKIYHSYWSNFCFNHLAENPSICSDFLFPKNNHMFRDFKQNFMGYILYNSLIEEIEPLKSFIPDFSDVCDHYYCSSCNGSIQKAFGLYSYPIEAVINASSS